MVFIQFFPTGSGTRRENECGYGQALPCCDGCKSGGGGGAAPMTVPPCRSAEPHWHSSPPGARPRSSSAAPHSPAPSSAAQPSEHRTAVKYRLQFVTTVMSRVIQEVATISYYKGLYCLNGIFCGIQSEFSSFSLQKCRKSIKPVTIESSTSLVAQK